ncbi:Uu.00g032320.m01.CDS01 [Anthostomella pinea]|uniref:Uu.00g032320.m01.CDS01 n=1 Tax=Anthostomella pinea TaxID=933095 RepID=A0AAI8V8I3_9PEZI|nr:Uu.00g032320.m01.CDS01 [Anthostomella pinea]
MSASAENLASASEAPHYVPTTGAGDVTAGDGHSLHQGVGHSSASNYDGATLTGIATSNNGAEGIGGSNVEYPPLILPTLSGLPSSAQLSDSVSLRGPQ